MSGWNSQTGLYELTSSQAYRWSYGKCRGVCDAIAVLEKAGIEIVRQHPRWCELRVDTVAVIYEALSGRKADRRAVAYHDARKPNGGAS